MPKFTVEHKSGKSVNSAYDEIKKILSQEGEIKKYDSKAKVTFDDQKKQCQIEGSQFKALMNLNPQQEQCLVTVQIEIPFLLSPFKGKIEEMLKKMLSKHLT